MEQDDPELLDVPVESLDAVVTRSGRAAGRTLGELVNDHGTTRGVFVRSIRRGGAEIPIVPATRLEPGDIVTLIGAPALVEGCAARIGFAERPGVATDMFTVGFGIAVGCLIGLPTFALGGVSLSLSTSVGTLLAGLFFGWLRSVRPTLTGRVPEASQVFMVNFGLAGFVAVTGLHAGPVFFSALSEVGLPLFLAGIVCTCVPPTVGVLFGLHVLKMDPLLVLGGVAGAQTMTAAMVAVQERAKSKAPVLGFTVPYALGNIILTSWGTVIVLLMT
jgi:putative transport protein